jgi:hypothetical protein
MGFQPVGGDEPPSHLTSHNPPLGNAVVPVGMRIHRYTRTTAPREARAETGGDRTGPGGPQVRPTRPGSATATSPGPAMHISSDTLHLQLFPIWLG